MKNLKYIFFLVLAFTFVAPVISQSITEQAAKEELARRGLADQEDRIKAELSEYGIDINNVTGIHYIDFVGTVVYTREKGIASISNVSLTDNADFTLSFIDDDDLIYDGVINTNTLNIADSTTLNNVMVTKYITTSSNVNLYTNTPSYVYVIIENSKLSSIQVQINSSIVNNIILPFATRGVFLRSGAQTWTHLYSETTASYDPSRA